MTTVKRDLDIYQPAYDTLRVFFGRTLQKKEKECLRQYNFMGQAFLADFVQAHGMFTRRLRCEWADPSDPENIRDIENGSCEFTIQELTDMYSGRAYEVDYTSKEEEELKERNKKYISETPEELIRHNDAVKCIMLADKLGVSFDLKCALQKELRSVTL